MILLAWAREDPVPTASSETAFEPKVLALSGANSNLTLIQDRTYEIVISDDKLATDRNSRTSQDEVNEESLRMVVINENGNAENIIKIEQGTLSSLIGAPLPTLQLADILNKLSTIFKNIRQQEPSDARQVIEMAKVVKNMNELSRVLSSSDPTTK